MSSCHSLLFNSIDRRWFLFSAIPSVVQVYKKENVNRNQFRFKLGQVCKLSQSSLCSNYIDNWFVLLSVNGNSNSDTNCYELGTTRPDLLPVRAESPIVPASKETNNVRSANKRERTFSFTKNATKAEPVLRTAQRTIYTAGRPPWYDTQGQSKECFLIGLFQSFLTCRLIE